eukprot:CAMPEP_0194358580 /NCGR_PEP_ID=MMETSP0174-20130528/5727_1 /TAXON_ID=216777 /ORGANISM="Proboscia alata, Strain PI-D3" /LENGTH=792 /DNA_ID=CAMNT_0039128923 /DNA_START=48 /DNA_END=2423 /DNA_ORIENTATION=-
MSNNNENELSTPPRVTRENGHERSRGEMHSLLFNNSNDNNNFSFSRPANVSSTNETTAKMKQNDENDNYGRYIDVVNDPLRKNIVHILQNRSRCPIGNRGSMFLPRTNFRLKDERIDCLVHISEGNGEENTKRKQQQQQRQQTSEIITTQFILTQTKIFAEQYSCTRFKSSYLTSLPTNTISTISVSFSSTGRLLASTHGDHSVKLSCCYTGKLLQTLWGHPRTPWTVKFHPTDDNIVASGCLGYQVRVWDVESGECRNFVRLRYAIISLSFHPQGHLLGIASGNSLHLWGFNDGAKNGGKNNNSNNQNTTNNSERGGGVTMLEYRYEHPLRSVHFPPGGKTVIVGGVNPPDHTTSQNGNITAGNGGGGVSPNGMSFSLRLWDFDLSMAMVSSGNIPSESSHLTKEEASNSHKRVLSNSRPILTRALLYNDGGLDVSSDGTTLCACAEFWVPDGVDSIVDHWECQRLTRKRQRLLERKERQLQIRENSSSVSHQPSDNESGSDRLGVDETSHQLLPTNAVSEKSVLQDSRLRGSQVAATLNAGNDITPPPPSSRTAVTGLPFVGNSNNHKILYATTPITPPIPRPRINLSPPSPPGGRLVGGLSRKGKNGWSKNYPAGGLLRSNENGENCAGGRYVPHVVAVRLDSVECGGTGLGRVLSATKIDVGRASGVTCVKFSPSANYILLGYGVREATNNGNDDDNMPHPVTALYRVHKGCEGTGDEHLDDSDEEDEDSSSDAFVAGQVFRGKMANVNTLSNLMDDVNIARFHPDSGHGFVYGTKQGKVRLLSPKPW